jgi:hypothetical protein
MGGFGKIFGGFWSGYANTMGQRHQERQRQFNDLMQLRQDYANTMARIEAKGIVTDADRDTYNYAYQASLKAGLDAEKAINQKMGGFSKLADLIFGGKGKKGKGGGAGEQGPPDVTGWPKQGLPQPPSEQGAGEGQAQAPEQPVGGPPVGEQRESTIGAPPPAAISGQPEYVSEETAAPPPAAVPARPSLMGLRTSGAAQQAGFFVNPYQSLARSEAARLKEQEDRSAAEIQTSSKLDFASRQKKQEDIWEQEDLAWLEQQPEYEKLSPENKIIVKSQYKTQRHITFPTNYSGAISRSVKGIKGKDLESATGGAFKGEGEALFDFDMDRYGQIVGNPRPAGVTVGAQTIAARISEEGRQYMAAHPGVDPESAQNEVRKTRWTLLDNRAKASGSNVIKQEALAQYAVDRTKNQAEIMALKRAGKNMTPGQAQSAIYHASANAQAFVLGFNPQDRNSRLTTRALKYMAATGETDQDVAEKAVTDEMYREIAAEQDRWVREQFGVSWVELQGLAMGRKTAPAPARARQLGESLMAPPTTPAKPAGPPKEYAPP